MEDTFKSGILYLASTVSVKITEQLNNKGAFRL